MKRLMCAVVLLFVAWIAAGEESFDEGSGHFLPYGYQRVWRWEQMRKVYAGERHFRDSLRQSLVVHKPSYLICPWWLEDLYCDREVAGACRDGIGYVGYVLDPSSGFPLLTNEWNNGGWDCLLNDSIYRGVPFDLVVYCRDGQAFDRFLLSEPARINLLRGVFGWPGGMINRSHNGSRPRGVHFYFPEPSFREKRAFTQFIRSVSMVIDSLCVDGNVYPYQGERCMFYITLPVRAVAEMSFLSGIAEFADEIYFTDYNEYGVPVASAGNLSKANDPTYLARRLLNQFYLFRLNNHDEPHQGCNCDLEFLAQADYNDFQWKQFFYMDLILIIGLLSLLVLYNVHSPFYMFIDRNRSFVAPVMITFVTEIGILFLYMLESISVDVLLFDMNSRGYLWLLVLPVFFILVHILYRLLAERRVLP